MKNEKPEPKYPLFYLGSSGSETNALGVQPCASSVPTWRARTTLHPVSGRPGEKNEKKRAGRMSRTQAEIDFEWLRINSGRLKIEFGLRRAAEKCRLPSGKNTFLNERLAGVRVATPQMGSKIGPKHLVFCSFTGKHGGARPPPNKQETRKPRTKLPQESRKTCKNMVFLYTVLHGN